MYCLMVVFDIWFADPTESIDVYLIQVSLVFVCDNPYPNNLIESAIRDIKPLNNMGEF